MMITEDSNFEFMAHIIGHVPKLRYKFNLKKLLKIIVIIINNIVINNYYTVVI